MSRPEERYRKLEIKTRSDGKVVYKSAIPLVVATDALTDLSIVAGERDRMDIIAHNVYGSAEEWWRIAAANKRVDGSLHLKPGTTVLIPKE